MPGVSRATLMSGLDTLCSDTKAQASWKVLGSQPRAHLPRTLPQHWTERWSKPGHREGKGREELELFFPRHGACPSPMGRGEQRGRVGGPHPGHRR